MATYQGEAAAQARDRMFGARFLLAAEVALIAGYAMLSHELRHGPELLVLVWGMWAAAIGLGIAFANISPGPKWIRALVVCLGLLAPFAAEQLEVVVAGADDLHEGMLRERADALANRHAEFLANYMRTPRRVVFVKYPVVVVEGGFSLKLYAVKVHPRFELEAAEYFERSLVGRSITATFPPDFAAHYFGAVRNPLTASYAKGPSAGYGDAPAAIFVDGVLVNVEIRRRWHALPQ